MYYKYLFKAWINDFWFIHCRSFISLFLLLASHFCRFLGAKRLMMSCCLASLRYRLSSSGVAFFNKYVVTDAYGLTQLVSQGVTIEEAASRTIILLWPEITHNEVKKGIVLLKFTRTFSYFLRNTHIEEMQKYFIFVLEPSWAGYADPDILAWMSKTERVIVQSSELQDRVFLNCLPKSFVPVSFGSGNWVNSHEFMPHSKEKIFDSIYIANTNPIKRVKRYVDAVKNLVAKGHDQYRGCLVCAAWGDNEKIIRQLVQSVGMDAFITLKFSLPKEEVVDLVGQSKTNILLSYKEGSNRSLFESMFCDVPVICLSENIGVNKAYINEFTGLLIPDAQLEDGLQWMQSSYQEFHPRKWALENISAEKTTDCLFEVSKARAYQNLSSETMHVKVNAPEAQYLNAPKINLRFFNRHLLDIFSRAETPAPEEVNSVLLTMKNELNNNLQEKVQ
ncbi:glycosyltransferase [Cellvibrio sp. PSBB006]|uniref:glycosyltransferase n=1 Tax=Cellvibrio sp. PSBB006 TaxID=1987723 RepID=UPI000B3BA05C|nr:glycosyltransferase [Cellvibrio sp. PSBB006]ARU28266.1 hypothetical protein CBR65_12975 [Cellvibrio sp. PSBB006]